MTAIRLGSWRSPLARARSALVAGRLRALGHQVPLARPAPRLVEQGPGARPATQTPSTGTPVDAARPTTPEAIS